MDIEFAQMKMYLNDTLKESLRWSVEYDRGMQVLKYSLPEGSFISLRFIDGAVQVSHNNIHLSHSNFGVDIKWYEDFMLQVHKAKQASFFETYIDPLYK